MYKRGYHYRCAHCNARRTLPRLVADYVQRIPRCTSCRHFARLKVAQRWHRDNYRAQVHMHAPQCTCNAYTFRHRKGSGFCIANPAPRSDAELQAHFAPHL